MSKLESIDEAERPSLTRFDTMPDVGDEEPAISSVKHSKQKLARQRSNSVDPFKLASTERLEELEFGEMHEQAPGEE